ncbi:outer membrane protein assembly factor BamA [Mesorhizobium sp. BAC0120]|uniref:outer membrane protein assembly factor BamA n=1 Tax=Mesorhizobium sp. BAC0120 TaxID=3090670 RepID=UPI00298C0B96|nr:outer membrane protein assembly factor BamA [Mesorhizobium sp. BAC0120]MDW6022820.1 outer membrane protein assembly factor BamA [Mesorhizobium sp. BAC0120]
MKASGKFLSAVSAVALSVGLVAPATVAVQFAYVPSAEAAVVSRISVEGNQRVDRETIIGYIDVKPGQSFSNADIDEAVKRLFSTGLFSDVRINQVGSTLVVQVKENSIVNQVLFQGNKKLKDNALATAVQLKPRGPFSQDALNADVEAVKQAYRQIGREDAQVTTQVIDVGQGRVNVVFEINEGGRTKIAAINFNGNNAFSDRRLSEVISTHRSTILSYILRDDVYSEDKLRADEEALRRFYFNHGFADFQVISSSANLDPATNSYTIDFTIEEGERYNFGDISIESSIEGVNAEALGGVIKTRAGEVYSAKNVEDTIIALTEKVAGMGYAFAQVTPRGDRNFENHTISVVYAIDQGPRTYVERIEIRGNERTRDYVIRREFDISEGDAFNQVLVQRAKRRLQALDYFQSVEISTAPGSEPDQVVLVVDVVEKSTGEFNIGAGYTTGGETSGPSIDGGISEKNFLGRGQYIKFSAGGGQNSRDFQLSFTEPYFLGRRISAGFDIYKSTRNYTTYNSDIIGATVRFGLPVTQSLSTQLAYNISQEKYKIDSDCETNGVFDPAKCNISPAILQGVEESPWLKSSVSGSLIYNTLDDINNPHAGIYASGTVEVAGLGGDAQFVKAFARARYYHTLSEEYDIVGLLTAGGGHVEGFSDQGLRTFDLFKNNDRMIRGFEYNGIGPVDARTGDHLGGESYLHANAEAQFPLPIIPESIGLRGAVFADAATVFGNNVNAVVNDLQSTGMDWRASVGAGLIWASPFGPLRIDYAFPVLKEDTDNTQNFNFGISTRF